MKILIAYSGGKDSQACLLWAVNEYGADNIEAVFCDTGWEHPATYKHIEDTCADLKVKLVTIKSSKYEGMVDMAEKKGRFASSGRRFCTQELKIYPMIDYVLKQDQHTLMIQGSGQTRAKAGLRCRSNAPILNSTSSLTDSPRKVSQSFTPIERRMS